MPNIFISHSWDYSKHYEDLVGLLEREITLILGIILYQKIILFQATTKRYGKKSKTVSNGLIL